MGSICYVVLTLLLVITTCIKGQEEELYDSRNSLDSFIHNSAVKNTRGRIITGILYDIPLPSNFSGIKASFIHLRSSRLWSYGANFSFLYIPPKTLSWPFSKRVRIVSQNLGNRSSVYYNVPNYTFVTPVLGFLSYDATNVTSTDSDVVEIRTTGDPVLIRFQDMLVSGLVNVTGMKCVQFRSDGEVIVFSNVNVSAGYTCIAGGQGHFGIVIPTVPVVVIPAKKSRKWKWWVVLFVVGVFALGLLIGVGCLVYKCSKKKKIEKMEKESERSVALESVWVGPSRMPKANGTRTQPIIEDSYEP